MNTTRVASTLIISMVLAMSASCGSSDNGGGASVATGGVPTGTGGASSSVGGTTVKSTTTSESEGGSTSATSSTKAVGGSTTAGGGAASTECPAAKPEVDSACTRSSSMGACTYSDTDCICSGQTWHCYTQADCPATAPANADTCDLNSMNCTYGEVECVCSRQAGWNCATPCPETKPTASGEACTRDAQSTCRYGEDGALLPGFGGTAASTCACADGALTCFAATDCPAEPPEDAAACTMLTLSCDAYEDRTCSCGTDGTWACTTECPEAPPTAGASCARTPQQACSYAEGALVSGGGAADPDTDCVCIEGKFTCYTQADCPATAPESDTDCTQIGMNCSYDDDATSCRCRTSTNQWTCNSSTNPNNGTAGAPNTGAGGNGAGGSGAGGTRAAGGTSSAVAGTTSS